MSDISVEVSKSVFNKAYIPHLYNMARTQVYYGGSSSGKSVFLAQRAVMDVMAGGRNYLICRAVGKTIRKSVFTEIVKIISSFGLTQLFSVNKSDGVITCVNGYQIIFTGLDDTEKVKSMTPAKGAITDIWVEEATETTRRAVKDLYKRQRGGSASTPKRLTLSFNPIQRTHWIYDEYFKPNAWGDDQAEFSAPGLSILRTTYKDNRFLTPDDIADLEGEADQYYRDVYTLGKWGVLGNVIFRNWETADLSGMRDQFTNNRYGGDFGFASDPAAVIALHYDRMRKTVYIWGEHYEAGLQNDALAEAAGEICGDAPITWDSSEPKSIAELQKYGLSARGARKGKDSVVYGIQWLQQQKIIIDASCINTRNEFAQYKWREDAGGNAMPIPVDKSNHLIDALRYALEDDMEDSWFIS